MGQRIFLLGTGTDVGKTVVSALLYRGYTLLNEEVSYWKPFQSGSREGSDAATIGSLIGDSFKGPASLFVFPEPLSPDQAALVAGVAVPTLSELEADILNALDSQGTTLVEGAGGALVPLNEEGETWMDFLALHPMPVVIVGHSGLGTLNHTGMTIETTLNCGLDIACVLLQGPEHPANLESLRRRYPDQTFIHVPHLAGLAAHEGWDDTATRLATLVRDLAKVDDTVAPILTWDRDHCWHPYTQHQGAPAPYYIKRAKGVWLWLDDGKKVMDATASWWVNSVGHGRSEIARAIHRQQQTLDHSLFAGATHRGAATLAKRLVDITTGAFQRAFFSDCGSAAVEIAVKIAFQSFANRGESDRRRVLSFEGGYHGDTFGAMSFAGGNPFHRVFAPLMMEPLVARPVTFHPSRVCQEGAASFEERARELRKTFKKYGDQMCCAIIEPVVQGASGMLMQSLEWLGLVADLCKENGVPLIFDEVFTGMGRTGKAFAYQRVGIEPDILCMAKGLTGGNLPLALTLCKEELFEAFLSDEKRKALLHGHSFTANAIACAAANETLMIFEREGLFERGQDLERLFQAWIQSHGERLQLENARACGGILAFEMPGSKVGDYFYPGAANLMETAIELGLLLRPLGNTVYLVPPIAITDEQLLWGLDRLAAVVEKTA